MALRYEQRMQCARRELQEILDVDMPKWAKFAATIAGVPNPAPGTNDRERAAILFEQKRREFIRAAEEYYRYHGPFVQFALTLDDIHLQNCRVLPVRDQILDFLPQGATVAEVGTQTGTFAKLICAKTHPKNLHVIDIDFSLFRTELLADEIAQGVVQTHQGDSAQVLSSFEDGQFDWIYIDADHTYAAVKRDAEQAVRKVKKDGILVFNDYTHWSPTAAEAYGVPAAVHELCLTGGWEFLYLALDVRGFYDVAVRRIPDYSSGDWPVSDYVAQFSD